MKTKVIENDFYITNKKILEKKYSQIFISISYN